MKVRTLQFNLPDLGLTIELEAEETALFVDLVEKLKSEGHLNLTDTYFLKTSAGTALVENEAITYQGERCFVLTKNPFWKPATEVLSSTTHSDNGSGDVILSHSIQWFVSVLHKLEWNSINYESHLILLNNIRTADGIQLNVNVVVQFSVVNATKSIPASDERRAKMRQVLTNIFNHELSINQVSGKDFIDACASIAASGHKYLTDHMEYAWNTKIDCLVIAGFNYNNNAQ
jgi:hypothetical protein